MNDLALTEDQRDCLQEVVNVAMGQAGDSLARFLEVFIHLSVPRIRQVARRTVCRPLALTRRIAGEKGAVCRGESEEGAVKACGIRVDSVLAAVGARVIECC